MMQLALFCPAKLNVVYVCKVDSTWCYSYLGGVLVLCEELGASLYFLDFAGAADEEDLVDAALLLLDREPLPQLVVREVPPPSVEHDPDGPAANYGLSV